MAKPPTPKQRQIFLACRPIFSGRKAAIRNVKAIRAHLQAHESALETLIPYYRMHHVLPIVKFLVEKGVFDSDTKAQAFFPDLQPEELDAPLPLPGESSADTPNRHNKEKGMEKDDDLPGSSAATPATLPTGQTSVGLPQGQRAEQSDDSDPPSPTETPMAPPMRLCLPYKTQHRILTTVQRVLEESIFEFLQMWLYLELASEGWDCPEAIELTTGMRFLKKWRTRLSKDAFCFVNYDLDAVFQAVAPIRHAAVHRQHKTIQGICDCIAAAQQLTEILQDQTRTLQLHELHWHVQGQIPALAVSEKLLQNVEAQCAQMGKEGVNLRAQAIADERKGRRMIGILLETLMEKIFVNDRIGLEYGRDGRGTNIEGVSFAYTAHVGEQHWQPVEEWSQPRDFLY
ncbi:uncharacterized protein BP01DRAFT_362276 [Aspergillus saccharolyticus JOP 1030-1]|uniref:Ubiquinol-cytochrome-c reductase cytochrome c1 n=1 Tax=Aspergillus saccharolyticus JOP 1030-1 TaxID=1450539 RepID=A0A318ZRV4_9EURO|nr:hypothetical protein BP01DRAFT_362276 [Aspergillus saccharolyticus JOP 1030-1]PYH49334.1 hypothetical protein BP01DRAFT_362276 [Aspergillus saccharolyticus JOP 1030-1]